MEGLEEEMLLGGRGNEGTEGGKGWRATTLIRRGKGTRGGKRKVRTCALAFVSLVTLVSTTVVGVERKKGG